MLNESFRASSLTPHLSVRQQVTEKMLFFSLVCSAATSLSTHNDVMKQFNPSPFIHNQVRTFGCRHCMSWWICRGHKCPSVSKNGYSGQRQTSVFLIFLEVTPRVISSHQSNTAKRTKTDFRAAERIAGCHWLVLNGCPWLRVNRFQRCPPDPRTACSSALWYKKMNYIFLYGTSVIKTLFNAVI